MAKISLNINSTTFPMPAAVISVGTGDKANLITLAYVGKVCMTPPIIAIGIRESRFSFHLLEEHEEFVINYPSKDQIRETDYCGTRSGKNVNKWKELNLTQEKASIVEVPMIAEFPWNMECKVINKLNLGSHTCFFGEVVAIHSDTNYVTNNRLNPDKLNTFAYMNGNYVGLEENSSGRHGFSMK
jgi:flavin reductase (DIM6/NTAB) family NADH-FMN oxidoreductase RutF